jgi:hypothetical protein
VRFEHLRAARLAADTAREAARAGRHRKIALLRQGFTGEVVGIEDAATALLLAAEKGRNGERYIVSERFMGVGELYQTAADASGVRPPRFGIPLWAMYLMGYLGDVARIALRRDTRADEPECAINAHLADAGPRTGRTRAGLAAWAGPRLGPPGRAVLSGESTPIAAPGEKTGSALRMTSARPGLTINVCRMTSH